MGGLEDGSGVGCTAAVPPGCPSAWRPLQRAQPHAARARVRHHTRSASEGHLRAKAAWISGMYCDISFVGGVSASAVYMALFERVMNALLDPELPVRGHAACVRACAWVVLSCL